MPAPSQLTIRAVGPQLRAALAREARRRRLSVNRTVLELLSEATGLAGGERRSRPAEHRDLDALAGTWSVDDARAFDEALAVQRQVDRKLWP
jgi:hypothetical protein